MDTTLENSLVVMAALPALYGVVCWIRRTVNTLQTARWVRETHIEEWNNLHWLAKQFPWPGIEVLVKKGRICGPEVDEFRARDEYFEKGTWIGLLISALLLAVILVIKGIATNFR
jgi:hypothetical protein